MIKSAKIIKKFKSVNPFNWGSVPSFAVICGVNGSGKTQLLEAIFNASKQRNHQDQFTQLTVQGNIQNKVQYIPANHQFGNLNNNTGTTNQVESRITSIVKYAKDPNQQKNNAAFNDLIHAIESKAGKKVDDLTEGDVQHFMPPNYMWYLDNGFNNQYISELFKAYQTKVDSIRLDYLEKDQKIDLEQVYKVIGFPPPWILINEIFDKYDFNYHIKFPERNIHYIPKFKDKLDPDNEVEFSNLSSGEKIIVSLILWAFNQKIGEKNTVFLLDEFDAHLNPSMSRMFIEIVKDKLVKEYGLQVLMTTHSPSTVAFTDEEDLFWMERGREIVKGDKGEVVRTLSDGVMTFDEASMLLFAITKSSKKAIVFTEGETDISHLKTAMGKLSIADSFEMFSCNGANKLKQFLVGCPSSLFNEKLIIGLFDFDREGESCIRNIQKESNFSKVEDGIYKSKDSENVFAVILPTPGNDFIKYKYCPIEFLYEKDVLEKFDMIEKRNLKEINSINDPHEQLSSSDYDEKDDLCFYRVTEAKNSKSKFAKQAESLDKDSFKNFSPLFARISKVVG